MCDKRGKLEMTLDGSGEAWAVQPVRCRLCPGSALGKTRCFYPGYSDSVWRAPERVGSCRSVSLRSFHRWQTQGAHCRRLPTLFGDKPVVDPSAVDLRDSHKRWPAAGPNPSAIRINA